ncbi:MAG TPA: hypothetical protein VHP31_11925 [Caproicibacter sp.]|nr:hypothetical protein [Caproicibacter sp.]
MYPYNPFKGQTIQTDAHGVSVDHAFLAHFQVTAASAVGTSATAVHAAVTLTTSAQTVTTAITNPAAPRNVSATGNASGITGNVVITGTNYNGDTITETIALNGTSTVAGTKAFASITSIALPAKTNTSGDTVSVGIGSALGLPYKLAHNTVLAAFLDNTKETTAPTVTTSAAVLESNTITLSSSLSGKAVDVYLMV